MFQTSPIQSSNEEEKGYLQLGSPEEEEAEERTVVRERSRLRLSVRVRPYVRINSRLMSACSLFTLDVLETTGGSCDGGDSSGPPPLPVSLPNHPVCDGRSLLTHGSCVSSCLSWPQKH